jgi:rod shape-determining protein MreC
MEYLLNRYRNLTVLLLAILAQLVLLAYQVKSNGEVRLIRVWAVTAVTPLARAIEGTRSAVSHFFSDYFVLLDVREQNKRMKTELDRVHMENQYLRNELDTADRAKSLAIFQAHSPSKTVAAHIIGNTTGSGAKTVIVDRGSTSGVEKEMAVITPDGIVGKVVDVYPTASFVLLATDPTFAAGVISQKNRVHGTLKGQGGNKVIVDYVQNEENVEQGEWFYTSGDDGVFPKGLPAGEVTSVHPGKSKKDIVLAPSGFQDGLEEVLIIIQGVHVSIPDAPLPNQPIHFQAPPPPDPGQTVGVSEVSGAPGASGASGASGAPGATGAAPTALVTGPMSDADRVINKYRQIGDIEKLKWGERGKGAPNFNIPLDQKPADPPKPQQPKPNPNQ